MKIKKIETSLDKEKILAGLKLAYERMIEDKRKNNGEIAIMQDGKIVVIKP